MAHCGTIDRSKKLPARFFQSYSGKEPVRDWIKSLPVEDRRIVGTDIQKVEFGMPLQLPYCRSLGHRLWEVRSNLTDSRIGRVIFALVGGDMVLLHGFIKKTRKTPKQDIDLARSRLKELV